MRGRRELDYEDSAATVGAVLRLNRTAHRLDKAAADGKTEPGARALPVAGTHAIEFVEDALQILARNALAFIEDAEQHRCTRALGPQGDGRSGRRIFRSVVQEIEEDLLKEHRIELDHGQIRRKRNIKPVLRENWTRAAYGTAD